MGPKTETKEKKGNKGTGKDKLQGVAPKRSTKTKKSFLKQNSQPNNRHIKFNESQDGHLSKLSNSISTTKYTIFTFFPKYLYEQFRKYWNVYFLMIGMMQQIPDISPTGR